ncbi:MAG: hypothetical protein WAX69_07170 [Victivallales bacterium]
MINDENLFALALLLSGIFFLAACVWTYRTTDKNISEREKLPRQRILGAILAGLGLFWCVFHSKPLVSPSMHSYLIPTAIFCTWIGYMLLDYLFARAFGGMLILFAHYFLHDSFAFKTPCKPYFSILCFVMGTFGIVLCGKPHLLRDMIRAMAKSGRWKYSISAITFIYAASYITYGLIHLAHK